MAYIGSSPTKVVSRQSANIFTYTATANQTAFTGADANGNTLACSPSDLMVHMNGIRLEESDYSASTTTVTLVSGAAAGDEVTITAFLTFESADHYNKSTSDTRYVNTSGDTMTGNLGIGASPSIPLQVEKAGGGNFVASFQNTTSGTPYGVHVKDASSGSNGYPLLQVTNSAGNSTYFRVDSGTGIVTSATQPAFEAYTATGSSTNLNSGIHKFSGSGAFNAHVFTSINFNIGSHYNSSTTRFTAPVAGRYLMYGGVATSGASSSSYMAFEFYISGTRKADGWNAKPGGYHKETSWRIFNLAANDYVEPGYENASTMQVISQGSTNNNYVYFGGYFLG